ncbi:hypothetical protein BU24DRAFT_172198 [Aaosphaeria arxii CBS 175.79]|uniref:WSC domain-containing protein n=1 Tax=Aaosphaeria arxii CBS 175.79 TaxID=1450172 RepID=A0A6A5XZU4_9PLEO|nr:uncharacterized protein BU24DRAFT_172198 [Aaosphaeria arxii CBS 175.79]KAF2018496.1 hypothetical protein BU24DRAFT_172198 [Aaosphaeria arxii CBS 175.79]
MFTSKALSVLVAASVFSMASAQITTSASSSIVLIPTPTSQRPASAITSIGCFKTSVPLEDHGPWRFQSEGNCQQICLQLGKNVMGLSEGTNCWCGDQIPPKSAKVANSSCETTCSGIDTDFCGGADHYWVDLTGFTRNKVEFYEPDSSSASSRVAKQTSEAVETAVVTETPDPKSDKSSGPNKVGIAVGVVVGVLALAAIIGGVLLFLRHKRRREVEEEYRRQAAVNSFVSGGKLHTSNSSMTDSRLDPEFMNRRQSNGSIADNEDYSRRILKVTNV